MVFKFDEVKKRINLTLPKLLETIYYFSGQDDVGDVPYLCKKLLGTWAEITSRVSSFVTIFGANVVYWILMSNCLYHSVGFLVGE